MSTIVLHSAVTADRALGSIDLAVGAARACLAGAGFGATDIDVLINIGVYRDGNVVEPSNAALIQRELGMHLDYESGSSRPGFSLDLRNGACGVLDAVQAASALIGNGTAERVLIVGSDAHPGGDADAFPFATAGGALLLGRDIDAGSGFGPVYLAPVGAAEKTNPGIRGRLELAAMGRDGQRCITIDIADEAGELFIGAATAAVRTYLDGDPEVRPDSTVLVTNDPVPGFAAALAAEFGFTRFVNMDSASLPGASTGLIRAFSPFVSAPDLTAGTELLLVAAGSGPSAGCVRYRVRAEDIG